MNWKWKESNALTLFALILGGACGLLLYELKSTSAIPLIEFSAAIGKLITNMVRIVVIPLIFAMLVVATSMRTTVALGRVLANSLATFVGLLLVGVSFSVLVAAPLVSRIPAMTLPTDVSGVAAQASKPPGEVKEAPAPTGWGAIGGLLPSNLVRAAANDDFLALVLFAMLLGFATSKLADELRLPLIAFAEASAQILRILTTWVVRLLPLAVFTIVFSTTAIAGWGTIGIVGYWIALVCFVLTAFTAFLYLIARIVGGVPFIDFAKSLIEAQTVAFATRSSIAALPALFKGAERHLPASRPVADIVLALSAGGFKMNRAVSSICRLLFLAHLYGMTLGAETFFTFVLTSLLSSVATPGVPTQGASTLPLYLAAGIPIEGVILLGSVDVIPDFFMTVLNVTGDMTAVTIVGRLSRAPTPEVA